jgi:hypothetical protein
MTVQHLDSFVAFAALMLGVSLLITVGTQFVVSLLGLRGANLRRSLTDLFETACPDREAKPHAKEIARRVLRHPLISDSVFSRFCIRAESLPFIPPVTAGKLRWTGSTIPFLPWILGAVGGSCVGPLVLLIARRLFVTDICQYSDLLTSSVPYLNYCQHPWRTGAIIGALFVGLISRWRLASSIRLEELVAILEKLSDPLPGTLPDPAQRAMLMMAWAENGPGHKPKTGSGQASKIDRGMEDFDEGIVRPRSKPESEGGGLAVALAAEKAVAQAPTPAAPRLDGLRTWFEHAMDRASQRFTLQARVITVVLSLVIVFAAHLDSIHLFQSLSSGAQAHAQMAGSADALSRFAAQIPRARESARTVVPDVYRKAMSVVLEPIPSTTEQPRPRPRRVAPSAATPSQAGAEPSAVGGQVAPASAQAAPEVVAKKDETPIAATPRPKILAKHITVAAPKEDKPTVEAKSRANKALEATPGFASREDAVSWLRATLDGDPALPKLLVAYDQEVNSALVSDSDKMIDHSASMKRELDRSEFQLLPEKWTGWKPTQQELPGLLVTVAFLSLGAAFWYSTLKNVTSLRPLLARKLEQQHARGKLA